MKKFEGDHLVHKQITEQRLATAWIGRDVIFGGEVTGRSKDTGTTTQFHPATIQWRTPSGAIGWVRLMESPMIDASADNKGLTISTSGTIRLRLHAKDMVRENVSATVWELPGLHVAVASDAKSFGVEEVADDAIDLIYAGITGVRLDIKTAK
jgi:hypothetical protein